MPEYSSLYRGHRFPAEVIAHAGRLSLRFALSVRDIEELLAERGNQVSDETVRRWATKFPARHRLAAADDRAAMRERVATWRQAAGLRAA